MVVFWNMQTVLTYLIMIAIITGLYKSISVTKGKIKSNTKH